MIKKNFTKTLLGFFMIFLIVLLIFIYQDECKNGVVNGILVSGNVIIPSLFPFTVCVFMLIKCGITQYIEKIENLVLKIFGLNSSEFLVFLLSFIGGYPIGAKLLDEMVKDKNSTPKRANKILMYSINGGPAFIVLAVGNGILNSKTIGTVLLLSHIISSLLISVSLAPFLKKVQYKSKPICHQKSLAENFVESVANASATILNICAFVIIFSAFGEILNGIKTMEPITYFLEITNTIRKTKNIYFISFLLGFGGISVWLQVLSCCKSFKVNVIAIIVSRIITGALNTIFTYIIVNIFKFEFDTLSNNISSMPSYVYKTPSLTVALIMMVILLIISLERKFDSGNLKKDLV